MMLLSSSLSILLSSLVIIIVELLMISTRQVGAAADGDLLDLYVFTNYRKWTNTSYSYECDFCVERDGCVATRGFFLQGFCMNTGNNRAPRIYSQTLDEDRICLDKKFDDEDCNDNSIFDVISDDDCGQLYTPNECNTARGQEMGLLENWCILSDRPFGEFEIPFSVATRYDTLEECQEGYNGLEQILHDDANLCQRVASVKVDGSIVSGSRRNYCEVTTTTDDDVVARYYSQSYSDRSCTESVDLLFPKVIRSSDKCSPDPTNVNFHWTIDCSKPKIFCKNFYDTDFGFKVEPSSSFEKDNDVSSTSSCMQQVADTFLWTTLCLLLIMSQ